MSLSVIARITTVNKSIFLRQPHTRINHPNTFIQGQYDFYYTECLMIQVCIMLLEGQLLKK